MVVYLVACILILSWRLGGKFSNLLKLKITGARWLGPVVGGQLVGLVLIRPVAPVLAGAILITSYSVLLLIVGLNRHLPGMLLVLCGVFLNFLVIGANGGVMPTTQAALEQIGRTTQLEAAPPDSAAQSHRATVNVTNSKDAVPSQPRLLILGDVVVVPLPGRFASVVSLGDLFIGAGLGWFSLKVLRPTPRATKILEGENVALSTSKSLSQ